MDRAIVGYLHPGNVDHHFIVALNDLARYEADHGDRLLWPPISNQSNYDLATSRNEVMAAWLDKTPARWLLFVDTDMGFAPDALSRLLEHAEDHPVIGGLCFTHKRSSVTREGAQRFTVFPTIYRYVETDNPDGMAAGFQCAYAYPEDTLMEVAGTGAAFLLIERGFAEAMREQMGDTWFDHAHHPELGTRFSEDLSFCVRVAAMGENVMVHTGVKTSHRKSIWLDEDVFLRQQGGS